jgi:hypothetical protein
MESTRTVPEEGRLSHYRVAVNKWGQEIKVPVIDVRDGIVERLVAEQMSKATNRSKYIQYTEYHRSKPKTNI